MRGSGAMSPGAGLIHRIEAGAWEEACAVHAITMGWGPYFPLGEAAPRPQGRRAMVYPDGGGECPTCGKAVRQGRPAAS
jgi:hypothetical protein